MGRRGRKRGKRKQVAHRLNKVELGAKQLPEAQPPEEMAAVPGDAPEPDSDERPHRGGERGAVGVGQGEEAVAGTVRDVPTDEGSGPAEERLGGSLPLDHLEMPTGDAIIQVENEFDPFKERLGDWPYKVVRDDSDALALGEWLQKMGSEVEKTPVGIAATPTELALATREQGWLLPQQFPTLTAILSNLLTERTSPALVTRDTGALVAALEAWLGMGYDRNNLLPNLIHDMTAMEYATGRPIVRGISPLKDALDCAVVGPGMALECPRFYQQVGLPLVRFNAKGIRSMDAAMSQWTVTYDWLLFRVLAHLTHDPTMTHWLIDGLSPTSELSSCLELPTDEAIAFLLWQICGEDTSLLSRHYPDWAAKLPEAPQLIRESRLNKTLPALRLGLIQLTEQYATARRANTLYGRLSPWGLTPAELLHFTIAGAVHDVLDVVSASILKEGSETHWLVPEENTKYNYFLRATIRGYTSEDPMVWEQKIEAIGALGQPLGMVPLAPNVSVE